MSRDFVSRNAIWEIIELVSNDELEYAKAISMLFKIIRDAHGQAGIDGSYTRFTPNDHSFLDYLSKSSSVIRMSEGTANNINPIIEKEFEMLGEFKVVGNMVRRINRALSAATPTERTIFLSKLLNLENTTALKRKYHLHNNSLYEIISKCQLMIRNEFNLFSRGKTLEMEREMRKIKFQANRLSREVNNFDN